MIVRPSEKGRLFYIQHDYEGLKGCITEVDWPDFAVLCSAITRFKTANNVFNKKGGKTILLEKNLPINEKIAQKFLLILGG